MKKKLLSLLIILMLCVICTVSIAMAAPDVILEPTTVPPEPPGPITAHPTPEPTVPPTPVPTPIPTTPEPTPVPTTPEPTPVPTTREPTPIPTTREPTPIPPTPEPPGPITAPPTQVRTPEPTLTITIEPTIIGGGKGYIDVTCNINGAAVYFDGRPEGTIVNNYLEVEVSTTGTPVRTVSVSAYGYTTWSGSLSRMPSDGETVTVNAYLNPIVTPTTIPPQPRSGAIYVQSVPTGAAISLNGNFQGYAPITIQNLPTGTYSMKATMNGYSPDTQLISVYSGQTAYYSPYLQQSPQPPRNTGTVYVTSNPNNAAIYIDGTYNGKTSQTVTLYPGNHNFVIKLSGYNDYSTTIWVNAGQAQNLPVSLTPAIFGSVLITSMPGASVYMDSNFQGQIGAAGTLTLPSVSSGNHLFKVSAGGYNDWINTVYIQPNYQNQIVATLTSIGPGPTPVQSSGGLNIVSSPSGAETYVDNLYRGYTPATLTGISPGQHQVLLKYTGYVDYSTTATVTAGQTTPIAITMTAAPVPTPTPKSAASPATMIGGLLAFAGIGIALRRRY